MRICTYGKSIDFGGWIVDYRIIVLSLIDLRESEEEEEECGSSGGGGDSKQTRVSHSLRHFFFEASE